MKDTLTTLDILRDARDSGLFRKAEQTLYYHLALRADQCKDYSTFVGYETLSEDTGLDIKTLQRAAAKLEAADLISRKLRPNHSNVWYLNVAKVREVARNIKAERKAAEPVSPFAPPVITDAIGPETVDTEFPAKRSAEEQADFEHILKVLKKEFPDHPTYKEADADRIMASCVETLVRKAGYVGRVGSVLHWAIHAPILNRKIKNSNRLGGFLTSYFDGWNRDFQPLFEAEMRSELTSQARGEGMDSYPVGCPSHVEFPDFVKRLLGDHLIDVTTETAENGDIRFGVDMTPRAKLALIITQALAADQLIDPNTIHSWVDEDEVQQAIRFVADDELVGELKRADDPVAYFLEYRWELAEDSDTDVEAA